MRLLLTLLCVLTVCSCTNRNDKFTLIPESNFEITYDQKEVSLYTLSAGDITMQVTNFGARVVSLWTPDKLGNYEDIVLGYEHIDKYLHNNKERFLGSVVGRYANRIANGRFTLDSTEYTLSTYSNGQCLHGGDKGFDMVVWDVVSANSSEIVFSYISPDMEEGFPGELKTIMKYTLTNDNEFIVSYEATTDKRGVVNLSHHSFFNLKGEGNGTITDHVLMINAAHTTSVDSLLIPTGEIASVNGTPLDFREPTVIGKRIDESHQQLKFGLGYDHNWVLSRSSNDKVELAATVYEPQSGRYMEVWTDQPAIQFYSGNFFNGKSKGKSGKPLKHRESLALETQKFPDSPNHPNFPSTLINPNEVYKHTCIYKFSVK